MPLFSSENWSGKVATSVTGFLIVAVALAGVRYVEWSSDASLAQFMKRAELAANVSTPLHAGRTGCPQGNKVLPSTLSPLD
ncbi:hypothetical protein [Bradyrhizobium elkanii]|uniref:hypothetical protein n=1 Tax=Bradyrhizobium elkanii TaxID=29448 RepID=UPI0020A0D418|nr:hypothetical protein [Bradyrhizobium elkanii]MCP1969686.1 hypothetical protein [Bradyrhizobium elkanii]MCS4108806.1 hypothetical protein [Bradyrhizobium elkanii]